MGEIASGGEKRHSLQRLEEIVTLSEVPTSTLHHGLGDKQLGNRLGLIGHQPRRRQKPLASVLVMVQGNCTCHDVLMQFSFLFNPLAGDVAAQTCFFLRWNWNVPLMTLGEVPKYFELVF